MVMRHTHLLAVVLCIFSLRSPAFAQLALPSNLHVAPMYREMVESMADRSPTFQGQLLRIGTARGVTVHVEIIQHIIGARAMTRMVRQIDGLTARVEVARLDNVVELIAHELEHVIEQIDRVDLAGSAGLSNGGIYSVAAGGWCSKRERAVVRGSASHGRCARHCSVKTDLPCSRQLVNSHCDALRDQETHPQSHRLQRGAEPRVLLRVLGFTKTGTVPDASPYVFAMVQSGP